MDYNHRAELRRFQKGEPLMLVARRADDPRTTVEFPRDLVHRAASPEEKAAFNAENPDLRCYVSSCSAEVTPHFRSTKRSSFAHVAGARHSSEESFWHHMAKAAVVQWVQTCADVKQADLEVTADDRSRRPDVVITMASGARIAVEVQYSALTVSEYRARTETLGREFTACVWVLGHLPPNFSPQEGRLALNAFAQGIIEDGHIPMWINPGMPVEGPDSSVIRAQLLTAWSGNDPHGPYLRYTRSASRWALCSLDQCHLDETFGIITPRGRSLLEAQTRRAAAAEAAKREERRQETKRARDAENARRKWEASAEKHWFEEWRAGEYGPGYSVSLGETSAGDKRLAELLGVTCEHWKTFILRRIDQADGWVSWRDLCRALRSLADQSRRPRFTNEDWRTLELFVRTLRKKHLIQLKAGERRPYAAPLRFTPEPLYTGLPSTKKRPVADKPDQKPGQVGTDQIIAPERRSATERPDQSVRFDRSGNERGPAFTASPHYKPKHPVPRTPAPAPKLANPQATRTRTWKGWLSRLFGRGE